MKKGNCLGCDELEAKTRKIKRMKQMIREVLTFVELTNNSDKRWLYRAEDACCKLKRGLKL